MMKLAKGLGVAVLASAFMATPVLLTDPDSAVIAQGKSGDHGDGNARGNGNAGSNGNTIARVDGNAVGNKNGNTNGNGQGALASMLKGLNAYHANPNAASSAEPNSQVGRIASYVSSSQNTIAIYDEWTRAHNEYLTFSESYEGPSRDEIQEQLNNLPVESETSEADRITLEEQLLAFEAYEAETARLMQISNDFGKTYESASQVEDDALKTAANGRTLSAEEEQQFRELLGL